MRLDQGAGAQGSICFDLRDGVLDLAFNHVVTAAGYDVVKNSSSATFRVVDHLDVASHASVVITVQPTALAASVALAAASSGHVGGVVASDDPAALPDALAAIKSGLVAVPRALVALAQQLPELTGRQHRVLASMALGVIRDRSLAQRLRTSTATIKREVRVLYAILNVPGRDDLARRAVELGYDSGLAALAGSPGEDPRVSAI